MSILGVVLALASALLGLRWGPSPEPWSASSCSSGSPSRLSSSAPLGSEAEFSGGAPPWSLLMWYFERVSPDRGGGGDGGSHPVLVVRRAGPDPPCDVQVEGAAAGRRPAGVEVRQSDDLHHEGEASRFRWLRAPATSND